MKYLTIAFGLLFSVCAFSVEGYKDYKFGINSKSLKAKKPCSLDGGTKDADGYIGYQCNDFEFGGDKTSAAFFFVNDQLLRVGIVLPVEKITSITEAVFKKYGKPSTSVDLDRIRAVDTVPNTSVDIGFDDDTVYIRLENNNMIRSAMLIYTSPVFDKVIRENRREKVAGDV